MSSLNNFTPETKETPAPVAAQGSSVSTDETSVLITTPSKNSIAARKKSVFDQFKTEILDANFLREFVLSSLLVFIPMVTESCFLDDPETALTMFPTMLPILFLIKLEDVSLRKHLNLNLTLTENLPTRNETILLSLGFLTGALMGALLDQTVLPTFDDPGSDQLKTSFVISGFALLTYLLTRAAFLWQRASNNGNSEQVIHSPLASEKPVTTAFSLNGNGKRRSSPQRLEEPGPTTPLLQ